VEGALAGTGCRASLPRMPSHAPADPPVAPAPTRPTLRPGVHVVRRDDRHLQVGVDPPAALVVPDTPVTRRLLEDLRCGVDPALDAPEAGLLLARLAARGLLVDATARDAALAGAGDRPAVTAAFAQFGDDAPRRLAARAGARVRIDGPHDPASVAARLLRSAGVALAESDDEASVVLVIGAPGVGRDELDPLVAGGLPHLVVASAADGLAVGPFVVPGTTACQRCVDAQEAESDPRRPMLLEQCGPDRLAAGPPPRDLALLTAALGLAARDLVSYVDGDRPATWSTTVVVGPDLTLARRTWRRHPHCGCAWDQLAG
jgi:hypothetical protein